MTKFQNRRQHWIFPFSVGVTNVQHVAYLSLRFISEKLMNSAIRFRVAPVAPKFSIPTLQNRELNPVLLPVSPLYYDRPHSGGRKGGCELGPRPYFEKPRRY
ncbi:hypothetical protein [Ruminococcus sp. YE282]|uniref:hypothetical protein n=1 Tax=Ruminococcus sp. YE282 TaxID=3158780 RepID=UPI000B853EE7